MIIDCDADYRIMGIFSLFQKWSRLFHFRRIMLQIKNLTLSHKKDNRIILSNFSSSFNDGDKAVIIGEEGNGKSTLLKWIYDKELITTYSEYDGSLVKSGERLAYLPQELPKEVLKLSVYDFFMQSDSFLTHSPKTLCKMAKNFGLPNDFYYSEQIMETLSGGEKIKICLMRLLLDEPTVLLLDEPSNDLDTDTLCLLENIINDFKHIVIFISHDEVLIENTANMVIHLEQIKRKTVSRYNVVRLPYLQYMEERRRDFNNQERAAENDRRLKKIRDEKLSRIYKSVEHAQATISRRDPAGGRLLKKKMHAVKSMAHRFEREEQDMTEKPDKEEAIFFKLGDIHSIIPLGKTVIEFELPKLYTPDNKVLLSENISLNLRGPEKICITGKNGSGKTSLIHKIAESLLNRTDIKAEYMPQNYEEMLKLDITPVEYLCPDGSKEERTKIRTFLGSLNYTSDEMEHPISELSGGQKAKIFLLKMSISKANVLILDEPTRNFSPLSGPVIRRMLREFPGAIISISHDRKYIEEVCDKVYVLTKDGLR